MTAFETIIRPFETRDVTPPASTPGEGNKSGKVVEILISAEAKTKTVNFSASANASYYMDSRLKETDEPSGGGGAADGGKVTAGN